MAFVRDALKVRRERLKRSGERKTPGKGLV